MGPAFCLEEPVLDYVLKRWASRLKGRTSLISCMMALLGLSENHRLLLTASVLCLSLRLIICNVFRCARGICTNCVIQFLSHEVSFFVIIVFSVLVFSDVKRSIHFLFVK